MSYLAFRFSAVSASIRLIILACTALLLAQTPQANSQRISEVDSAQRATLKGSVHPLAQPINLIGHAAPTTQLTGVTLHFKPSATQQAALESLLAAQQNPSSPHFHKWLTPVQFQAQFGLSAQDQAQVTQWLQAQGLAVSKTTPMEVVFSGDVQHLESAFQTTINRYHVNGTEHLANATQLSLPASIANVTAGVRNLAEFRPKPRIRLQPRYTSSISGDHYIAPSDFETIYDVSPLYNAGFTGSGETIAVVGQSSILASDVAAFRTASGLSANAPTFTLVPGTGTSASDTDDEQESDLDVEWSGAIAENATINFIYTGSNQNYGVFDALQYAVDNDAAPVISISYGECEADASSDIATFTTIFEQANAQGETIVAASGDSGAADCDDTPTPPATVVTTATHGLAVDVPAASPLITGIGGTEFLGDVANPGTYWNSTNNSDSGSAITYIPEEAWNDTSTANGLSASGGGKSTLFSKPSWQTGTGIPADGQRDVPDLALNASPDHDGYLFCSQGSCSNGFRDSNQDLTVAGGTSFGAPTFSGVLTLINQKLGLSGLGVGQGNINPSIYSIAASTPSAFHDITIGNNEVPCAAGSPDCGSSGVLGYVTTTGYDQVTGWGSIDANELATAFSTSTVTTPTTIETTTSLTANPTAPITSQAVTFAASVSSNSGSTVPTGTIQFAVDGANVGSAVTLTGSTSSASATYSYSGFTTSGSHTVTATYSGDSTHAGSAGTLTLTIGSTSTGTKSFTLSASAVTIAQGSSGTSTISVTPAGGYTGTVALSVTGPSTLTDTCYTIGSADVTGTTAATATLTINTTASACATAGARKVLTAQSEPPFSSRSNRIGYTLGFAMLILPFAGLRRFRHNWLSTACLALLLATGLLSITACGGGSTSTPVAEAAQGTYTLTITGTDSTNNLTATTPLTLTIN